MAGVASHLLIRCLTMTLLTPRPGVTTESRLGPQSAPLVALLAAVLAFAPDRDAATDATDRKSGRGRRAQFRQELQGRRARSRGARGDNPLADDPRHRHAAAGRRAAGSSSSGSQRGRKLDIINGQVARPAELRHQAARSAARDLPGSLRPSDFELQLPDGGHDRRADRPRHAADTTGAGVGVAVIDSGIADLARRPDRRERIVSVSVRQSARRASSSTSSTVRRMPYDDNGHGTHVAGHHRRQRLRLEPARRPASRPRRRLISLKVLDAQRHGHDQQHHRGARLGGREPRRPTTSASSTCRSARAITRVLLDRPADAGGQGARPIAASSSSAPPATSARTRTGQLQYGGITAPAQRAVGADGRRLEHQGTLTRYDDTIAPLQLVGPDQHRLRGEARPGCAGHGHGLAGRAGQHASTRPSRSSWSAASWRLGYKPYLDA